MNELDPELWKFGFSLIIGGLIVFFLCGAYVITKYFKASPNDAVERTNAFLGSEASVRLATVAAVTFVVCILSLFGSLSEGAIAILSGITGYVLGGLSPSSKKGKSTKENES
ncbi:MAG: hypothetical protein D8M57_09675 [Candidatus Scalindua sp. AMX11]|nr:MAG: hypothetical protein DWQ00_00955 [Candidatus Scalindua sp.]NOG82633.1 hypothetical protein [Planctomycetota bacterium]RZV78295.1 MAG: hypothetical protein EX341_11230 [Candidatus Scalindua sp. SCAELEC01]TDE65156.1 MAG: hypothetical protein D8M57_09675 [Candidatus Scalindua sp. AMX11]GJQ59491.1 MAG: hypothetical protein SCALA701_22920 [Candidatus Scalindua sp.]